jgi:hypothetical protein
VAGGLRGWEKGVGEEGGKMGGGNQGQVLKYSVVVVVAALQATSKEMSPDVPRTKRDYNNKKNNTNSYTYTHTHIPSSQLLEQNLYQNYAVSSSCCCFLFLVAKFL